MEKSYTESLEEAKRIVNNLHGVLDSSEKQKGLFDLNKGKRNEQTNLEEFRNHLLEFTGKIISYNKEKNAMVFKKNGKERIVYLTNEVIFNTYGQLRKYDVLEIIALILSIIVGTFSSNILYLCCYS